jgi:hypothetical protein
VIDGATGLSDNPPLVARVTDAAWVAEKLSNELRGALEEGSINPISALSEIEDAIKVEFAKINSGFESTAGDQPSAAFALTALTNDIVHLIGLADCRIIFESQTGDVKDFNPSDVGQAESLIVDEQRRLAAAYPNEDVWPRLKDFISIASGVSKLGFRVFGCAPDARLEQANQMANPRCCGTSSCVDRE